MKWSVGLRRAVGKSALVKSIGMSALVATGVVVIVVPMQIALGARNTLSTVHDPGPRQTGGPGAGGMFPSGLTTAQQTYFNDGKTYFTTAAVVPCSSSGCVNGQGLGPVFNENQCSSCHAQPAVGGGSPSTNPLFSVYQLDGAQNVMPTFESLTGPTLIARVPFFSDGVTPDGSVHQLFTIAGRTDAAGCTLPQPTIPATAVFHQPLPIFGDGLLEIYNNATLTSNMSSVCSQTQFGICGTPSISPNDGSVMRFGWKGQWRSLTLAAGEEYNVEMGITNEFFPTELNQTTGCQLNPVPETGTNFTEDPVKGVPDQYVGQPTLAGEYMRFLAGPAPVKFSSAAATGQSEFITIGCALCHTAPLAGSDLNLVTPTTAVSALSQKAPLAYTDLMLHHMGSCLADGISLGSAQGDMFRTPPLWGDGLRLFFLHDGRTADLLAAIQDHFCAANGVYPASEANNVINAFNALSPQLQQDILDFIRDL